jgi:hypothetical protein
MTKEADAVIDAWLALQRTPEDTPEWWQRREAALEFVALCANDPEVAWEAILEIARRETDEEILAVLAAWPLEDLLSYHGEAFIDRVEAMAHRDPHFRSVLAGTWQDGMTDAVWQRVLAASNRVAA